MKTTVGYRMTYELHPWDKEMQKNNIRAWILRREVRWDDQTGYQNNLIESKPVALFNLDSEGSLFQRFVEGGGKIDIDPDIKEALEIARRRK